MHRYDIALLTDSRYVAPPNPTWYEQNILKEDELLTAALMRRGLKVTRTKWNDDGFDWRQTRAAVFRTTWDYFHRFSEFKDWLERVSSETQLINPLSTIRWNMDKHYLLDLQAAGIGIPPTMFIEQGDHRTLQEILNGTGWNEYILKPAVSGAARHTYRFMKNDSATLEHIFSELIGKEAMLLQEFQQNIISRGEIALMCFGGKFTHAVLKKAKPGDFRVQDDFGGSVHHYAPTDEEILFSENVVAQCSPVPVYARVDLIWDNENRLCVSELEVIEPELWMRNHLPAAEAFADGIVAALNAA